jgi:hypothetical protein
MKFNKTYYADTTFYSACLDIPVMLTPVPEILTP